MTRYERLCRRARSSLMIGGALIIQAALAPPAEAKKIASKPNILLIVADDLGYSDVGAFGGEVATPNLDALAAKGMVLANFHTSPSCSPTRAMLLTGADNHKVGLGAMAETLTPEMIGHDGYEGVLNGKALTLSERLQKLGYFTAMSGKWHLGLGEDQSPASRGFERSYVLLQGSHHHFGDDQGQDWVSAGAASTYRDDGAMVLYPRGAFSADVFTDKMLTYLSEASKKRRPFFAYLAFTQPHWPIQAPEADIRKYRGRYDAGPAVLRAERIARMKKLGLIPQDMEIRGPQGDIDWTALPSATKGAEARKLEE